VNQLVAGIGLLFPGGGGALPDILVGDQNLTKLLPSIQYSINEGIAISAEINHILSGKNTLSGTGYSIALIFKNL